MKKTIFEVGGMLSVLDFLGVEKQVVFVYLDMIAELADEEGIDRRRVAASNDSSQRPEQNFVRRIVG
jgi:hypothetical protein